MEYILILALQLVIGIIFISSGVHKISNFSNYISDIKSYKLLPNYMVVPFGYFDIGLNVLIFSSHVTGKYIELTSLLGIGLLIIYTAALSISLIRGYKNLNCGCGGVVGSHKVSWKLVLRNLLIIGVLILIAIKNIDISMSTLTLQVYLGILSIFLVLVLYNLFRKILREI